MALVLGTNCGFVTVAPVADPSGFANQTVDGTSNAFKHTSPSGTIKITEIGWWCDNNTEAANFQVGLYDNDGEPNNRLFVDTTNAKGTTAGWKTVSVDWEIDPNTIYWMAVQVDDTNTTTETDWGQGTSIRERDSFQTSLTDPWGSSTTSESLLAIYAVVEAAPSGTTRKIKISGTFQDKPIKTKVAGVFVDKPIKIKVGGSFQDA